MNKVKFNINKTVYGTKIDDAFWNPRLDLLYRVTLNDTFDKLERDKTLKNFEHVESGGGEHYACPWHDGLLYEAIRGASDYMMQRGARDEALEARIDGYIWLVAKAQDAVGDGYLSTYTLLLYPENRFGENGGNLIMQHDLYNCGCLLEAGVHYYRATGKAKLLAAALKCAGYLCDYIGPPPKKNIVPAHSMIEGTLLELYQLVMEDPTIAEKTGVPVRADDYLKLTNFFVRMRGRHEGRASYPHYMGEYAQDHAPIDRQEEAVGHAVRAMLYFHGAAQLAVNLRDEDLLNHLLRLWNSVENQKMYINGGVGATHFEEKFAAAYELPNNGYMETCATVALMFWADGMSKATGHSRYYDVVENSLFNLMLSSVSTTGDHYFYRNPMTSKGDDHRWAWNSCPCCPPMIHKLFGYLNNFIYAVDGSDAMINLYIASAMSSDGFKLTQKSGFPWNGSVELSVDEAPANGRVKFRLPGWAKSFSIEKNGMAIASESENGYLAIPIAKGDLIQCEFPMEPMRIQAHPYVRANNGRVAIRRGPIVFCVEGVDNNGEVDRELAADWKVSERFDQNLLGGLIVIAADTADEKRLTAIPLYAWDNRASGGMNVWLRQEGANERPDAGEGWADALYRPYKRMD